MKSIGEKFYGKRKNIKDSQTSGATGPKKDTTEVKAPKSGSKPHVAPKGTTKPGNPTKKVTDKRSNSYVQGQKDLKIKKDPFVNFGSVIEQFLQSDRIGRRTIEFLYDDSRPEGEKYVTFNLTYAALAPTGMSYGKTITDTLDEYMSKRHLLFGNSEVPTAKWAMFVKEIYLRLQVEISSIPPPNLTALVIENVKRHLAPIELGLVNLTESEWNRIDSGKVATALKAQRDLMKNNYPTGRDKYLNACIKEPDTLPIEPVSWKDYGIYTVSKSDMLTNYCHKHTVSNEDVNKVSMLETAILRASTATPGT